MSTASTARRLSRSRAWLRALVLLLALLVPGAHAQAHAVAVPTVAGAMGSSGELAEPDVLDTVLRPPARPDRRDAPRAGRRGPGPLPRSAHDARPCPPRTAPPRPSYDSPLPPLPHLLRTVVLRC
ncbi:hypothetical protein ACFZBP_09730 [Streptomyces sp. NPDC008086]|uniref:hypothetical protein n=1 Tax=Streptomyces sp. NPDC008086 TaxID=3364807 RepID=UPI0036E64B67